MIYTLTFNPSLDYYMNLNDFITGQTNRSTEEHYQLGGKGINVSILLNNLGVSSNVLGYLGGFNGDFFSELLKSYHLINNEMISISGNTRINIKIKAQVETELNANGPLINEVNFNELLSKLNTLTSNDIVVIAGKLANGLSLNKYNELLRILSDLKVPFIIDIDSPEILNLLKYEPLLIKPNLNELELFFNTKISSVEDIIKYGSKLHELGAKYVIVSLGKEGSIMICADGIYQAIPIRGKLVNSVGAGDSMVGGFIKQYLVEADAIKLLKFSSACGSATAFGSNIATQEDVNELYSKIEIRKVGI